MGPDDVLRASEGRARDAARPRRVFLFGAGARLGERVLEALLAAPAIARVRVATVASLPSSAAKLEFVLATRAADLHQAEASEVAVLVLGEEDDAALGWRSVYGRDRVFSALPGADLDAAAHALAGAGVTDLVVIAPTPAHLQSRVFDGMLSGALELGLLARFARLVVIRPGSLPRQGSDADAGWMGRLMRMVLSPLSIMVPAHRAESDHGVVAKLTLEAVLDTQAGFAVIDSSRLALRRAPGEIYTRVAKKPRARV